MSKLEYKGEYKGVTYEQLKFRNTYMLNFKTFKVYTLQPMQEEQVKQYIDVMLEADRILNRV
jgi:bacterioferritin (cytochrome b1)